MTKCLLTVLSDFGLTLVILLIDQPVLSDIFLLVFVIPLVYAIHSVLEFTTEREIRVSSV